MKNETVLTIMNQKIKVLKTVRKWKLKYVDHIVQPKEEGDLLKLIMQGKKRPKTWQTEPSWLENLWKWYSQRITNCQDDYRLSL